MRLDRTTTRFGVAIAAVPVVSNLLTELLLELLTSGLFDSAQATRLLHTVFDPVAFVNVLLTLGVLVVAPAVAFYLAFPEHREAGAVVAGFAVGAVVYGAGVATVGWAGGMRPPVEYPRFATWLVLLFGGVAALGALAGDTVGPLFRAPEGADGEHPRW
jgi:hypothetical protein